MHMIIPKLWDVVKIVSIFKAFFLSTYGSPILCLSVMLSMICAIIYFHTIQ